MLDVNANKFSMNLINVIFFANLCEMLLITDMRTFKKHVTSS
jgi:hypothetical protein